VHEFSTQASCKIASNTSSLFQIDNHSFQFVSEFKYIGHLINSSVSEDSYIHRRIRNMFMRTNMLIRCFGHCSVSLKRILFKSYNLCLYDTALWRTYFKGNIQRIRSHSKRCLKCFWLQSFLQYNCPIT